MTITMRMLAALVLLGVAGVGCTRPNPDVCCISAEDCSSIGADDTERPCAEGLACVNHVCEVASCATDACGPSAPVCDIASDTCGPCSNNDQCDQFTAHSVCEANSGACVTCTQGSHCPSEICSTGTFTCVECLADMDCPVERPICGADRTCGMCGADSDCPSGVCDVGMCVPEQLVHYVAPSGGVDVGPCTRAAPCATFGFATTLLSVGAPHIVALPGTYVNNGNFASGPARVVVHGAGAIFQTTTAENTPVQAPARFELRGAFIGGGGFAAGVACGGSCLFSNVTVQRNKGIDVAPGADVVIVDSRFDTERVAITLRGTSTVRIERSRIQAQNGSAIAEQGPSPPPTPSLELTNALVISSSVTVLSLPNTSGTIRFSTIVNSGSVANAAAAGVSCGDGLSVRDSIIWTPNRTSAPISGLCQRGSSIAGPVTVAGLMNVNPGFVGGDDYHIVSTSPAKDMAIAGPPTDFEGDLRPNGAGYDIGADETD